MASSGPAPTASGLSCAEGSRAGHRTPGRGSQQSGAEGQNPLPQPAGHKGCTAAHVNGLHGQQNYQRELLKPQRWLVVQQVNVVSVMWLYIWETVGYTVFIVSIPLF